MLLYDAAFLPVQSAQKKPLAGEELQLELDNFHDWADKAAGYSKFSLADRVQLREFYRDLLSKPEFSMDIPEARYWASAFMYREPSQFIASLISPKPTLVEHYKFTAQEMEALVNFSNAANKDPALALEIKNFDNAAGANNSIVCFLACQVHHALTNEEAAASSQNLSNLMAIAQNILGEMPSAIYEKLRVTPPLLQIPALA
jgi:hypothetical protein